MENKRSNSVELADIFGQYGQQFCCEHTLCSDQHRAMQAIINCRTAASGTHARICNDCGHLEISYSSCRNRHCPKCQYVKQVIWADKLKNRLLPTRYFHVVFTIPEMLKTLFYINQRTCYALLFRASAEAIRKAALNPAFLGAQTGNVSVLHTWGQTLTYHPHIHAIVPAGGLDSDNMQWIKAPKKFFVPVKALSRIFRASFCKGLEQACLNNELIIPDHRKDLYLDFKSLKGKLYEKNWHVYVKKCMRGAAQVINYLGRYTHRVAISNSRILSAGRGKVRFRWKDYRDNHFKVTELPATDFIRRFLQHILPCGFYKIRYFGIYASANAKTKMTQCFALLNASPGISTLEGLPVYEVLCLLTGKDPLCCPACKKGRMIPYEPGYVSGKATG